jgi:hypothetical protein
MIAASWGCVRHVQAWRKLWAHGCRHHDLDHRGVRARAKAPSRSSSPGPLLSEHEPCSTRATRLRAWLLCATTPFTPPASDAGRLASLLEERIGLGPQQFQEIWVRSTTWQQSFHDDAVDDMGELEECLESLLRLLQPAEVRACVCQACQRGRGQEWASLDGMDS